MKELPTRYEAKGAEDRIYKLWMKSGFFNPDKLPGKRREAFSILMPPPNANDPLHIGHAVFATLQDIMVRYQRMRGKKALWLPGEDHAGFETQVVYEKKLEKQGRSRFRMGRQEFYEEVYRYTQENRKTVRSQLQKLGASCDWSRDTFTLDKHIVSTVYKTFKKLVDEGLVYRGERLVNFCTKHQTAFSDLEIRHETRKDPLYYIQYGPIQLATVRPETKFGDTAIAVHPSDKRYKKYVGQEIEIETLLGKKKIKVVADNMVAPEFGTGAVKVTPAHDANDFELWGRHKGEIPDPVRVIGKDGRLTEVAGPYAGLKVMEARVKVVEDLKAKGLLVKTDEDYEHALALCYKCGTVIEPQLLEQWFLKTRPLAEPAIKAVKEGKTTIIPKSYEKTYFHWLKNIRDWNISRQNWWGIEIPAFKCQDCQEWTVSEGKTPASCSSCKGGRLEQDPDVFDTWFSSGQWPFAVLKFPEGKDYKEFYPTSVMETAYDILFFWVARMMMLGLYRTGNVPFKTVYLHGLVRDKDRQKMSKSKGNVVDPLGVLETYGTDALRLALTIGSSPGQDAVISEDRVRGYRNFVNKLWNIARFVMRETEDMPSSKKLSSQDRALMKETDLLAEAVTQDMERYRFSQAAERIYHYAWHRFADEIIEDSKKVLADKKLRAGRQYALTQILHTILILLHPFAPFVTEELYQKLPRGKKQSLLMIEKWPA